MSGPADWVHLPGGEGPLPDVAAIGGKAHGLARLEMAEARVPPWLAIGTAAWDALVARGRAAPAGDAEIASRRAEISALELPRVLREAVLAGLAARGFRRAPLAVRSSATVEDAAGTSYAGQFASVLGARAGEDGTALWDAVRAVWASAHAPHALAYCGDGAPPRMAVVIQALVDPAAAGVAFSADPLSGDTTVAVVNAVYGLGEGMVSGELDADEYRVDAAGAVVARIADKPQRLRAGADGEPRREAVPAELRAAPVLSDAEAARIAAEARRLAAAFGAPQDVEWALAGRGESRTLWILQARPITALPTADAPPPGRGERRVWDNSNLVESYGGVTSPLTFSFARGVYEQVYRQFCELVGVPDEVIERERHTFAQMLGMVRGHVYYNLLNWYRVLALLPGYRLNRGFMERMMGVGEKLPDPPELSGGGSRAGDAARVARTVTGLLREQRRLAEEVPAFRAHVNAVLEPIAAEALEEWDADRLVALYRRLEGELLGRWQTPIVNDFFAMVWFGVLGKLAERWLPGAPQTLVNDLLMGSGEIVSLEPARRIAALARRVQSDPALRSLFASQPDDAALWSGLRQLPGYTDFVREVDEYLERWGDRCPGELKLETVTPRQAPSRVLARVRAAATAEVVATEVRSDDPRAAAERRVAKRLGGLRRGVWERVLRQTRERVRDRENLRYERTRVFGLVRRIFLALGAALAEAKVIERPRDVFLLTVEEIFGAVEGTGASADLRLLVKLRWEESLAHAAAPPPPSRFATVGPPGTGPLVPTAAVAANSGGAGGEEDGDGMLRGTGCCTGTVRAPVCVVRDPAAAGDLAGRILVAERTDPGWTLLFPAARGLLVERGSLLSHSAIVAREMGLPCVVGIPRLLARLQDGEMVEMDGAAGTVRRLEE